MSRASGLLLTLSALLAACASPPTRYYVLSRVGGGRLTAPTGALGLRVDRVRIPSELDRSQIVRRLDANRLEVASTRRWAAPLDEMIRRVLSADLAARLPPGLVIDPYLPLQRGTARSLRVDIHELYGGPGCEVTLSAAWLLTGPEHQVLTGTADLDVPSAGRCPDALAATMSAALGRLSDRIAAAVIRSRS